MSDDGRTGGAPWGSGALLAIIFILYAGYLANLGSVNHNDPADSGLASAFAAFLGLGLWACLLGLHIVAWVKGERPAGHAFAAVLLVPLSGIAALLAIGLAEDAGRWLLIGPAILPPLLVLLGLWNLAPAWRTEAIGRPVGAMLGAAILVLSVGPVAVGLVEEPVESAAEGPAIMAAQEGQGEASPAELPPRSPEEERFLKLGPQSPLEDWLEFLPPSDPRSVQALAGARQVHSRNGDAALLLQQGHLADLPDLWQLDLDVVAICGPYGLALQAAAGRIEQRRGNRVSQALELERQMPNIEWLAHGGCAIDAVLADLEKRLRAIPDTPRLGQFADRLAALRGGR